MRFVDLVSDHLVLLLIWRRPQPPSTTGTCLRKQLFQMAAGQRFFRQNQAASARIMAGVPASSLRFVQASSQVGPKRSRSSDSETPEGTGGTARVKAIIRRVALGAASSVAPSA